MRFELSGELIDELLFYMEDQNGEFFLDTSRGIVVNDGETIAEQDEDDSNDRYITLPDWGPSEGFRLMERFIAGLHNPAARKELAAALDRGKGVFRAFKDTIAQYPEVEKLWFNFKDRHMKREITRWYNSLRELWGLELIGEEPEDIESLALEDFHFRPGVAADREAAEKLRRLCAGNGAETEAGDSAEKAGTSPWIFPGDICVVTESSGGEFAAYISAAHTAPANIHIYALEVTPEHRGLGLGKTLLSRLLEIADNSGITGITIDIPAENETFSRVLNREFFKPKTIRYCRNKR